MRRRPSGWSLSSGGRSSLVLLLAPLTLAACTKGDDDPTVDTDTDTTPSASPLVFGTGAPPKNLLMISMDTFRRDAIGRYGGGTSTPFLDGIAQDGVALDAHTSCSNWTFHATTCVLAGSDPLEWGFVPQLGLDGRIVTNVPAGNTFLSTDLDAAGFTSTLVTTNSLISEQFGNGTGYDDYYLLPGLGNSAASEATAEATTRLQALTASGVDRWFMHVHLMEPHRPYVPPDEYLVGLDALPPIAYDLATFQGHDDAVWDSVNGMPIAERDLIEQHMRLRYAGEIAWLDAQLAAWWQELDANGWLDDTLVVFWTDHGEQMWEHGYQAHAFQLHAEENDAVLLFWSRDLSPTAWTGPTTGVDLAPTLLDLYGAPIPARMTGLPLGAATDDRARFGFSAAKAGIFQSVRQGTDRLVFGWYGAEDVDSWQVAAQGTRYIDLLADPGEQSTTYDPNDPRVQELWNLLLPRVRQATALLPAEPIHWPAGLPQ
jgi:arylsulfatase A-like enzyme